MEVLAAAVAVAFLSGLVLAVVRVVHTDGHGRVPYRSDYDTRHGQGDI